MNNGTNPNQAQIQAIYQKMSPQQQAAFQKMTPQQQAAYIKQIQQAVYQKQAQQQASAKQPQSPQQMQQAQQAAYQKQVQALFQKMTPQQQAAFRQMTPQQQAAYVKKYQQTQQAAIQQQAQQQAVPQSPKPVQNPAAQQQQQAAYQKQVQAIYQKMTPQQKAAYQKMTPQQQAAYMKQMQQMIAAKQVQQPARPQTPLQTPPQQVPQAQSSQQAPQQQMQTPVRQPQTSSQSQKMTEAQIAALPEVLRLDKVSYYYESDKYIFKDISFNFKKGCVYAIVGKSGAGKTTMLSLLAGLDKTKEGRIFVNGKDIADISKYHYRSSDVGVVFQSYNLLPKYTAMENVILSMDISGKKYDNKTEDAKKLLASVGLKEEEMKRRVLKLSGGQQQRVAIARSISFDPDIILADEPTGNLDPDTQDEIMKIFLNLAHQQNKCVIIVTHSSVVASMADCIYQLGEKGPKSDMLDKRSD